MVTPGSFCTRSSAVASLLGLHRAGAVFGGVGLLHRGGGRLGHRDAARPAPTRRSLPGTPASWSFLVTRDMVRERRVAEPRRLEPVAVDAQGPVISNVPSSLAVALMNVAGVRHAGERRPAPGTGRLRERILEPAAQAGLQGAGRLGVGEGRGEEQEPATRAARTDMMGSLGGRHENRPSSHECSGPGTRHARVPTPRSSARVPRPGHIDERRAETVVCRPLGKRPARRAALPAPPPCQNRPTHNPQPLRRCARGAPKGAVCSGARQRRSGADVPIPERVPRIGHGNLRSSEWQTPLA